MPATDPDYSLQLPATFPMGLHPFKSADHFEYDPISLSKAINLTTFGAENAFSLCRHLEKCMNNIINCF
jgi:hypothetical protein